MAGYNLQSQDLRSYVISSHGAAYTHDGGTLYVSVGEPLNTEIENGDKIAQGFLQVTILNQTVATEDELAFGLKVFPNPVHQYLNIELDEHPGDDAEYLIMDNVGRLVKQAPFETASHEVDFKDLGTGIYFLQLRSEGKRSQVIKIIKQNL